MTHLSNARRFALTLAAGLAGLIAAGGAATAQSSASSYSYGTYNPVQAAINRNSMNEAIIRQATGAHRKAVKSSSKPKPKAVAQVKPR